MSIQVTDRYREKLSLKGSNIMKQQQAFGGNEKMLKGGLHCHTTRSDGRGTPEEVIMHE